MTRHAYTVAQFLASGGKIYTRIRERLLGEIHDCPPLPFVDRRTSLEPEDVVFALEELEQQGAVSRSEVVHPYDSSEYTVMWCMAAA